MKGFAFRTDVSDQLSDLFSFEPEIAFFVYTKHGTPLVVLYCTRYWVGEPVHSDSNSLELAVAGEPRASGRGPVR